MQVTEVLSQYDEVGLAYAGAQYMCVPCRFQVATDDNYLYPYRVGGVSSSGKPLYRNAGTGIFTLRRYASYISAFVWFGLFVGPKLVHIYKARRARKSAHTDRLTYVQSLFLYIDTDIYPTGN